MSAASKSYVMGEESSKDGTNWGGGSSIGCPDDSCNLLTLDRWNYGIFEEDRHVFVFVLS